MSNTAAVENPKLVLESSTGSTGMTILSPIDGQAQISFGDAESNEIQR